MCKKKLLAKMQITTAIMENSKEVSQKAKSWVCDPVIPLLIIYLRVLKSECQRDAQIHIFIVVLLKIANLLSMYG